MAFLTTEEVATIARVRAWTVKQWINKGKLKAVNPGGKTRLINEEDLNKLLAINKDSLQTQTEG